MDYFTAKVAIAEIMSQLSDADLPEIDVETRDDGATVAWDDERQIGYHLGSSTRNGKPTRCDYRDDAIEQALVMESVHRAEAKWWMRHGAALAGA
ncbi:hypothetical protein ACLM5J_09760 [Nocardioides sp. Bht2]|uniref:hypothetical protein n=1 Tax=Nocardioides sp. Bht2 TaxID=3392297 RepID=UPI0039B5CD21